VGELVVGQVQHLQARHVAWRSGHHPPTRSLREAFVRVRVSSCP
jgi:hypothetical protein